MALSGNDNIIVISAVFSVVAAAAVVLRLYARSLKRMRLGADDYTILPALAFAVGLGINNIIGKLRADRSSAVKGNLGGHTKLGPDGLPVIDETITVFLQTEFACQLLSVAALTFTKLSILLFYHRIFRNQIFHTLIWVLGVMVIMWGISFFFATLFECYPISQAWTTFYGQPRQCYEYLPMFFATAITNMVMDLTILTIPWPMIWKLQMPLRQKVAVTGIFLLGGLVCGISVARLIFFVQAGKGFDNAYDVTYNLAPTIYWTQLEAALGVTSACLPTLRPIFRGHSPDSLIGSFRGRLPAYWQHKGSGNSSYKNAASSEEGDYPSSIRGLTKGPNDAVFESHIEGTRMSDLDVQRGGGGRGIMVSRDISFRNESA